MIFYLIGVDSKIAKIEKREEAVLLKKRFSQFLSSDGFYNARLLSTCNRFEIYDVANDKNEAIKRLDILKKNFQYLLGGSYEFVGEREVFSHLLKLGCGLLSQLKAEKQILEQLISFRNQKDFPEILKKILDAAISAASIIRTKTGVDKKNYNMADLTLEDVADNRATVSSLKIAIIGTGKIAELFASNRREGVQLYFLAHKNYTKANELAARAGGIAVPLTKIDEIILDADILISATSSPHYILRAEFFKKIMAKRKKSLYVYDLAVPRDIDCEVSGIDGIILKNMDDLTPLFEKHNQRIKRVLLTLEALAQKETENYGFLMKQTLKMGIRPSSLAQAQAQEIKKIFSGLKFEVISIRTAGDKDKITPLDEVGDADFFTREIDKALLEGKIDIAVHSSKDLARKLPDGLMVVLETESLSPYEALVTRNNLKLKDLTRGARVGVSSQRRKEQLKSLRSDLTLINIRGNIEERLALIDKRKIDALVVAHAALIRLGLEEKAAEVFSPDVFPAHPKQGKLALVARSSDKSIINLLKK